MRKDYFSVGDFVHIIRRGGRGLPIVKNKSDFDRLLKVHFYLNDTAAKDNWFREISSDFLSDSFQWPKEWPKCDKLFELCGFTFLSNHYHLIGLEKRKGGISKFMQKSGISISKYYNEKYTERGSLFQGAYKARRIDKDDYLHWVIPYVMAKNTFEMHPKGYAWAVKNFDVAWRWAINYPYSSLGCYAGGINYQFINTKPLQKLLGRPSQFKNICKDMIIGRENIQEVVNSSFE